MALTQISTQGIKDGTITNADLNASAAIARTKLANVDLVDDTSPQLGGNLDTNGNLVIFPDSNGTTNRLLFGTNKFQMYYNSGNSRMQIDNITGDFSIRNQASGGDIDIIAGDDIRIRPQGGENGINLVGNGAVELYHDNSKKFETTSAGVSVTGSVSSSGNISLLDTSALQLGTSNDFTLTHNGTNSVIDNNTGDLIIRGDGDDVKILAEDDIFLRDNDDTTNFIHCINGGAVELYHNGSKKFETLTNGVHITGTTFLDDSSRDDGFKAKFGTGDDLQIYHDGSNSYIEDAGTGLLKILTNGLEIKNVADNTFAAFFGTSGASELYFNGSKKFETTSIGVKVSANSSVDGLLVTAPLEGTVTVADERGASFKASFLMAGSAPVIRNQNTSTSDSTLVIQKGVSTVAQWDGNGHYLPGANNTYDIGSTSLRWRNIYTNDLNLSNEGSANDVDGTWGSYTIQEGAEDLFLVNKRSGKKYKFNLTEVS